MATTTHNLAVPAAEDLAPLYPDSPARRRFVALIAALRSAIDAEGFLASPAAWDPALSPVLAEEEGAFGRAGAAARAAGDATIFVASDRALVFGARTICATLGFTHGPDQLAAAANLVESAVFFRVPGNTPEARRTERLLAEAFALLHELVRLREGEPMAVG